MRHFNRLLCLVLCAAVVCDVALTMAWASQRADQSDALASYIARPDESFTWRQVAAGHVGSTQYVEYLVTSQTWRGFQWKHTAAFAEATLQDKREPPFSVSTTVCIVAPGPAASSSGC